VGECVILTIMTTSLYVHIPFCRHRCSYCDFNTYAGQEAKIGSYVDALCQEIARIGEAAGGLEAGTVFLGGGTPSLLSAGLLSAIVKAIQDHFTLLDGAEITLEANPGTVDRDSLERLREAGYNRISFGVQSAHPDDLRLLEREHDFLDVVQAVKWARQAGFDNLSLDLIFGVPGQPLARWQESVRRAVDLQPQHLSFYALSIEHGTPFLRWVERGLVGLPDDDLAAEQYEWAQGYLEEAGFRQYEISNWAREEGGQLRTARHNLQYWRGLPYLGFGAGAHGYAAGFRTANVLGIQAYIERMKNGGAVRFPASPAAREVLPVDRWTAMQEHMMVGLRLTREGVSAAGFERLYGWTLEQAFGRQIDLLMDAGLLEWSQQEDGAHLRLSPHGVLLGNRVFSEFVGNPRPDWLAEESA